MPDTLDYISGTVSASAWYDAAARSIVWQGNTPTATAQTIKFRAVVSVTSSSPIVNTAWLADTRYTRSRSATAIVNGWYVHLPVITRQ